MVRGARLGGSVVHRVLFANRCVAVSPAARRHGVEPGLRRREAQARCPSIELVERDEQLQARRFEVGVRAGADRGASGGGGGRSAAALPTRGPSRYHGGDAALARLVHERVGAVLAEHLGGGTLPCRVGVGVADGPRAAAIAAQEAIDTHRGARPVVVPEGATAAFLAPLPVERLSARQGR